MCTNTHKCTHAQLHSYCRVQQGLCPFRCSRNRKLRGGRKWAQLKKLGTHSQQASCSSEIPHTKASKAFSSVPTPPVSSMLSTAVLNPGGQREVKAGTWKWERKRDGGMACLPTCSLCPNQLAFVSTPGSPAREWHHPWWTRPAHTHTHSHINC